MPSSRSIYKSPHDRRQYRYLTLDNKLRVLLIEDKETTQSAASLAVEVGYFDDPDTRPGMAHFLEHMLFLGTQKYPDPHAYHAFINQHGGNNNAWTGAEHTNFFFDINSEMFTKALEQFSQFFIAPLFAPALVERERQAIDSEFSLKRKDDSRGIYQVIKESANPQHPFAKFSVGNLQTLGGDITQLRQELMTFYQSRYSANLMTLCLISPKSLNEQEQLSQRYFKKIKNLNLQKDHLQVPLFTKNKSLIQINITPFKENKRLSLNFNFPSIDCLYKRKPITYISYILGDEGKGSLLSYLKSQGLANQLSAGGGVNGYNFKDYSISLQLTDKGLTCIDTIIQACFEYIELIKRYGLEKWRYAERATLMKTAFHYQDPAKAINLVSHLSINMHHYDIEDIIFGDYRMDELDVPETLSLLELMQPSNMRIHLIAPSLASNKIARWYSTPYQIMPCHPQAITRWQVTNVRPELRLPKPNHFIVHHPQAHQDKTTGTTPELLCQGLGYRMWHQQETEFTAPKGYLYLSIDSNQACNTPQHTVLTRLYVDLLLDCMAEPAYPAKIAGLSYHIYPHQSGFTLQISGFTGNQERLLNLLVKKIKQSQFAPARFEQIKTQLQQQWRNAAHTKPISQLFTSLIATLQNHSYEPQCLAKAIDTVTLEDLYQHIRLFYRHVFIEGLIYGDWRQSDAKKVATRIIKQLFNVALPSNESPRELINITSQHTCQGTCLRELAIDHQDSAIIVYYQSHSSTPEAMALFSLLNHIMSSSFFHRLRTEKQLGYMVGTGYLPLNRYPGLIFYIQSSTTGPFDLLHAIDEFILHLVPTVTQLKHDAWESTKTGLVNQIMEPDANAKMRSQRYWISIGNRDYQFKQRNLVAERINTLTKKKLIEFINNEIIANNSHRLVLFNAAITHMNRILPKSAEIIYDVTDFKLHAEKFIF